MEKPKHRVLMVDDYEPWRKFILSSFQRWPEFQIVGEAFDEQEALPKWQKLQPDLVLMDIGLPGMNGIEVARKIRQDSPNARILFCSENRSSEIVETALRAGAGSYLLKSDAGSDLSSAVRSAIEGKPFVSRSLAGHVSIEPSHSGLVPDQGHVVQFYDDDTALLGELAALFRGSLNNGCSVAAIMTSSHLGALERRLLAQGVCVSEAAQNGKLCMLDADQALSGFMDSDGPSRERFLLQFGNVLRKVQAAAVAKHSPVVVFGEMVAVLWEQKKYEAAIQLEQLWNELATTCSFYLCCAYPARAFRESLTDGTYAKICAQHSGVV